MPATDAVISYVQKNLQTSLTVAKNKTINEGGDSLFKRFPYLRLEKYLDDFLAGQARGQRWVVMPGLRGTGKSTLLSQLYLHLIQDKQLEPRDVLYFSADDAKDQLGCGIRDVLESYEATTGQLLEEATQAKFLLIDEAHFDASWAPTLKAVYERAPRVFILVTGSSALALQTDRLIGADLERRVQWEKIEPLRFAEFMMMRDGLAPLEVSRQVGEALFASATAAEAATRLESLRSALSAYTAKFTSTDVERFLAFGSFPYSVALTREEAFGRIYRVTRTVLERDIPTLPDKRFSLETLGKFPQLVTLLADWEDVSVAKLQRTLGIESAITVTEMLEALKKCELIHAVPTFGGTAVRTTRPPRYTFAATGIKAAFLWGIGKFTGSPAQYGKLLEDLFVHYFHGGVAGHPFSVFRIEDEAEVDFVIQLADGSRIACEIGYGPKSLEQVTATMKRVKCKYGLVISSNQLAVHGDIVVVPKEYLLAY